MTFSRAIKGNGISPIPFLKIMKSLKSTEHLFYSQDSANHCGVLKKHTVCFSAAHRLHVKRTNPLTKQRLSSQGEIPTVTKGGGGGSLGEGPSEVRQEVDLGGWSVESPAGRGSGLC